MEFTSGRLSSSSFYARANWHDCQVHRQQYNQNVSKELKHAMRNMKRRFAGVALSGIFLCPGLLAQRHGDPHQQWQEKYPSEMARLEAMTVLPISTWRYHDADISHGEDPSLDDSAWQTATLTYSERRVSDPGAGPDQAWYRTTFMVPSTAGGKDITRQ